MTLNDPRIKVAPSILAADFSRLGEQVAEVSVGGADYIHVDVMDGHFVPVLTIGPQMVKSIRPWTELPLDIHMMVSDPQRFIPDLANAGADIITFHTEAVTDMSETVRVIKQFGLKAGVAISPATSEFVIEHILDDLDLVLVMSVNPGFGGQTFIEDSLGKIERVRGMLDSRGLSAELEVDGGVGPSNARAVVEAGARVLVAGSAVYSQGVTVAEAITRIRDNATNN